VSEWQPIETAPDDGTDILVVGGMHRKATIRSADSGWWRKAKADGLQSLPTHWQPLPNPPEQS